MFWGAVVLRGFAPSNYSTYVAVILMAKAQGLQVTFYTNKDSNGYCHIGYINQQ